jgi:predicted O-methyltransferase YrrM
MKKHWSVRYLYNRIKNYLFEKKNPHLPWINKKAINIFESLLIKKDVGVEFGSGRSTIWFSEKVKHLTSIEDNKEWFLKVKEELTEKGVNNVSFLFKKSDNLNPSDSDYCKSIESFKDDSLDFIIIDGKYRDVFALKSLKKIKKGGFIYLDDANRYYPFKTSSPYSIGEDVSKMNNSWKTFKEEVDNWRKIITKDGVSDGVFFIKN